MQMVGKDSGRDFSQDRETPRRASEQWESPTACRLEIPTRPARSHGLRRHARTLDPSAGGYLVPYQLDS